MTVAERPPTLPMGPDTGAPRRPTTAVVVAIALGLFGLLVVALTLGGGAPTGSAPGLDSAGLLVDWGVPVARLAGRIAALGAVGALLFAAVLRPARRGLLPASSRRALRAAAVWATAWAAATAIHALLTLAQLLGGTVTPSAGGIFLTELPAGRAALVVVAVAALVAALARRCTGAPGAAALLAVALAGLVVPAVLTGHSSAAENHVLAVTNLSVHVVAASVWVGGLLALLVHGRGRDDLAPAASRFSAVALGCFVATGLSGLLAAGLLVGDVGLAAVLGTGYGWLLAAKTTALVALGVVGRQHRRRTLPRLHAGEHRSFRRFAGVEAGIMLATIALAVALSSSPPPAGAAPAPPAPAALPAPSAPGPGVEDMSGHDHGDLSVTVLVDESRFHVSAAVAAGARVTVFNGSATEVTITAADGTFDVAVPAGALITFPAPDEPGSYPFASRHAPSFTGELVVR